MSPLEKLHNKPLDYSDFKPFGCIAFVSTLLRNRTKFEDRAEKGIFLGYEMGMKGYRIYSFKSNKVLVSRNVRFFEHIFAFKASTTNEQTFSNNEVDPTKEQEEASQTIKPDQIRNRLVRIHN